MSARWARLLVAGGLFVLVWLAWATVPAHAQEAAAQGVSWGAVVMLVLAGAFALVALAFLGSVWWGVNQDARARRRYRRELLRGDPDPGGRRESAARLWPGPDAPLDYVDPSYPTSSGRASNTGDSGASRGYSDD